MATICSTWRLVVTYRPAEDTAPCGAAPGPGVEVGRTGSGGRTSGMLTGLGKAHYKQIRRLEVIDAIPKSAAGKILRRVLRDPART